MCTTCHIWMSVFYVFLLPGDANGKIRRRGRVLLFIFRVVGLYHKSKFVKAEHGKIACFLLFLAVLIWYSTIDMKSLIKLQNGNLMLIKP